MNIVVLDGGIINPGDVSWDPIARLGKLKVHASTTREQLARRAKGADVLVLNKVLLDEATVELLPDVRIIALLATGVNNVAIDAFAAKNIPVCNVVAYGVDDVAQHAIALVLELCRETSAHTRMVQKGRWQKSRQWCFWSRTPICLEGLTLGVVGFGHVGRRVAEIGHALGMRVLAHSPRPKSPPSYAPFKFVPLEQLFRESNVVSLHCPLTGESKGLVNARTLTLMPDDAILVNTARGPLVDEQAVADALASGKLHGYGCDVLSTEPPCADNPLLSAPHVLITPHMAWATVRARQNIINLTAENIRRWQDGHLINVVNGVRG